MANTTFKFKGQTATELTAEDVFYLWRYVDLAKDIIEDTLANPPEIDGVSKEAIIAAVRKDLAKCDKLLGILDDALIDAGYITQAD